MSEYLLREIDAAPNIAVRCRVAVTGGAGQNRLESLTLARTWNPVRPKRSGREPCSS